MLIWQLQRRQRVEANHRRWLRRGPCQEWLALVPVDGLMRTVRVAGKTERP